jgi:hypothetical protein
MKTIKFVIIGIAIIISTVKLYAQDQVEALKFSQQFPQSDARALGAGNAYGAVGASLISSTINPGSLALYKKSEFSFSLGFLNVGSTGNYLGTSSMDHKTSLNLPQIGIAITNVNTKNGQPVKDGWVSYTFSGTINRTNSFQANKYFEGTNTQSSVLYYYAQTANGTQSQNLSTNNVGGLAWDAYLIDTARNNPAHNTFLPIETDTNNRKYLQQNSMRTKGSSYDINIALAGNYSDKVFIGAALSFPTLNYKEQRDFTETNNHMPSTYLSSDYTRELDINGTGVQASFGIIVKPIKYLRFGGSIQSPTFYSLHANYNQSMTSSLSGGNGYTSKSDGQYDFNYSSPFKATGSIAIIAGKHGFISADYEFVDYSQGYYSSNDYSYSSENNRIKNYYTNTSNIRIGGELKLDMFAIRAGYDIFGSPYKSTFAPAGADGSANALSFGLGMRDENYFIDFGFQQIKSKEFYLPYSLSTPTMLAYNVNEVPGNIYNITRSTFLVTFGLKF